MTAASETDAATVEKNSESAKKSSEEAAAGTTESAAVKAESESAKDAAAEAASDETGSAAEKTESKSEKDAAVDAAAEAVSDEAVSEAAGEVKLKSPEDLKAEEAFQKFLGGSKKMTCHKDNIETNGSDVNKLLEEGKEYTYKELCKVAQNAEQLLYEMVNEKGTAKKVKVEYAFLEDGVSPLMALQFKTEEEMGGIDIVFILEYDEDTDQIDLALGRDEWMRGFTRINTAGIVMDYGTYSAFESNYAYFQVAGGRKVNHIYSVFYDNRKAAMSNLTDWEKDTYLCSYSIPREQKESSVKKLKKAKTAQKQENLIELNTLHRCLSGDCTFVIEPDIVFDRESNRAVELYEKEDYTITDNRTVIGAVIARCSALNISIEQLFAEEPEWKVCK